MDKKTIIILVLGTTIIMLSCYLYRLEKAIRDLMEIKELLADELEKYLKT